MSRAASAALAAIVGGVMLASTLVPASAFTLPAPGLAAPAAAAQIDKVWWRAGWGWRGYYYRPAFWGHCWRGYYGRLHCS